MKTLFKLLLPILIIGLFLFVVFFGYDSDYGFYKRNTPFVREKLESYSYLSKRFDISINSIRVEKDIDGRFFIEFNTKLKSESKLYYENLSITPGIYVYLKSNNDEMDFYSIDLKKFLLLKYGEALKPNREIEIYKRLYFDEVDNEDFDPNYLNFAVSKVILNLDLMGKDLDDKVNTKFPFLEEDITEQFKNISK
jgi:hypothetical protein